MADLRQRGLLGLGGLGQVGLATGGPQLAVPAAASDPLLGAGREFTAGTAQHQKVAVTGLSPSTRYLYLVESQAPDGTVSIQQPMIEPLFGGRTAAEVVAAITGYKDQRGYDIVRSFWMAQMATSRT